MKIQFIFKNLFKKPLFFFLSYFLSLSYFSFFLKKVKQGSKKKYFFFKKKEYIYFDSFFFLDIFNFFFFLHTRFVFRFKQVKSKLFTFKFNYVGLEFFLGFFDFFFFLKNWLLAFFFFFFLFYFFIFIRFLPFNKIFFEFFLIIMFLYWLISGFVFFFKKYQFGKFTSVIQRFWKRTYILFWLIESGVFLVFFYLTLNASEEPVFMYDQLKLYKSHFFSWRIFIFKLFLLIFLIFIGFFIQLNLKFNVFSKNIFFLILNTIILVYIFWLEFYQFFHIINFYNNLNWYFDNDEFFWNLELEFRRTRLANNYISICLMAKFWHLVFIFVFWVFFLLRLNELKRIRYSLLAANNQNFIILYLMSWLYMYPWLKFYFKGFFDLNYYWFFLNNRSLFFRIFFTDIKLFFFSFFNKNYFDFYFFSIFNFFYFFESTSELGFNQFKKHFLKDFVIISFNLF